MEHFPLNYHGRTVLKTLLLTTLDILSGCSWQEREEEKEGLDVPPRLTRTPPSSLHTLPSSTVTPEPRPGRIDSCTV